MRWGRSGCSLWAPLFTGQERDPEASQDYFGARYYQPRVGRFSQVDPVFAGLFDPQQWNRYAYVRNNPVSFVDPDGRECGTPATVIEQGGHTIVRGNNVCPTIPTTPQPGSTTTDPRSTTDPMAAALALINNSCFGEGNSRACGKGTGGKGTGGGGGRGDLAVTVSFAASGSLPFGVETGVIAVLDDESATVTEYYYVGGGLTPGISGANGAIEFGLVGEGVGPTQFGWQGSLTAAVGLQGATGNAMGSGLSLYGGSAGYAFGLAAGGSGLVTYTWKTGTYDLGTWVARMRKLTQNPWRKP